MKTEGNPNGNRMKTMKQKTKNSKEIEEIRKFTQEETEMPNKVNVISK
jgi:hypothetical protein